MQSHKNHVEAVEGASIRKEQQPERERAGFRRRGTQKKNRKQLPKGREMGKRRAAATVWKGEGEEGRTAAFPSHILSFSLKYPFFEHIDSVTLFSCLNSLLERIKFNPSLFLGSVLFCIPLRPEGNSKDKWSDNHRPHRNKTK